MSGKEFTFQWLETEKDQRKIFSTCVQLKRWLSGVLRYNLKCFALAVRVRAETLSRGNGKLITDRKQREEKDIF